MMEDLALILGVVLLFVIGVDVGMNVTDKTWNNTCRDNTPIVIDKKIYYCAEKK